MPALLGLTLLGALLQAFTVPVAAMDRTVARITDLQGQAGLEGETEGKLRILARVRSGSLIHLQPGASLTLHFPATRTDYRFTGPDLIRVEQRRAVSSGNEPEVKTHSDIGVNLDLANTDLGAISMRSIDGGAPSIRDLRPSDTRVLLSRPVTFRWQAPAGAGPVQLVLSTADGHTLFSRTTADASLVLPPDVRLEAGGQYRWRVSAERGDAGRMTSDAAFSVAPTKVETSYFRLATLSGGSVSDLVLQALYLEQLMLQEEADRTWQYLETRRPGIQASH